MNRDIPIACNLDALSETERQRRPALAASVRERVVDTHETERGFRLRLSPDAALLRDALDLICLERRCCPFLEMKLVFTGENGPVYFDIEGNADAKAFLVSTGVLGCGNYRE